MPWLRWVCVAALATGAGPAAASARPPFNPIAPDGGENVTPPRDDLSPADEQALGDSIQRDVRRLQAEGKLAAPNTGQPVLYGWPVQMAPGLTDYAGFYVSAFSDHDVTSAWLDYNNGSRTYNTHRGTDIALWPFSFNKLYAGEVQVVAAAAGTIIQRQNTVPKDNNCPTGDSVNGLGNYIVLGHADGRFTIYGHMKYNSLTAKPVGQTVALGEYLGTVGSSGNSSGPHVHFEVRTALFDSTSWTDPFTGPANPVPSSWISQRPYHDSAINKLATSTALPDNEPCLPTITNIAESFPAGAHIVFQVYYRDYQGALPTQLSITDPNSSNFHAWSYTDNSTPFTPAAGRYWSFNFPADAAAGTWRFRAVYNGQTYETFFNVGAPPTVTVGSPNGGEQWDILLSHPITWTDNLGSQVSIALLHNGVLSATLASATPSDGQYDWVPGHAFPPGPGYAIRVSSVTSPAVSDQSDAPFTLLPTTLTDTLYLPSVAR